MKHFKIGELVKKTNQLHAGVHPGDTATIKSTKQVSLCNEGCGGTHYILDKGDSSFSHCSRNLEAVIIEKSAQPPHQVGTIFSVLNEKEAKSYIGRMVEFCDNDDYRNSNSWKKGIFGSFMSLASGYPFVREGDNYYHLIRLIPESFEEPKPKIDPGLIEALKKSVQQWQIMYDTGKSKDEVYEFLGGDASMNCFLCNFVGVIGGGGVDKCRKCIDWNARYCHDGGNSPFESYRLATNSKPAILGVLNHLKSELVRLESLSK